MPAVSKAVSTTPRRVDIPGTADSLDLSTMGGRITWARIRKELRQEDVAERLGKSRATIVQYEKDNIMPPIPEVERLAKTLDVTPAFLAFGQHGIDTRTNKADEIVTVAEITKGSRGVFETGSFAMPRAFFRGKDINLARTKAFVLNHDEPEFGFYNEDRIIIDQSIKDVNDGGSDLFLAELDDRGPIIVRREGTYGGKLRLLDGTGKTHLYEPESVNVLGSVNGVLGLV
jgi:transcriptional regulator with XRE-family HTH domain